MTDCQMYHVLTLSDRSSLLRLLTCARVVLSKHSRGLIEMILMDRRNTKLLLQYARITLSFDGFYLLSFDSYDKAL